MLHQDFVDSGFRFIDSDYYINSKNNASIHDLKKIFDEGLDEDVHAFRRRAYLKLQWSRTHNRLQIAHNQEYFQTAGSNIADGGKIRKFKLMNSDILNYPIMQSLLQKNLDMVRQYPPLLNENNLTIGLHFIRYLVTENGASYSSPDWLHKDDEPLVFIHLIHLSKWALGGDNLIAESDTQKVTHVMRLENDMDTLVLNRNVYHAVTPLGSKKGISSRDVILFTVEPSYTQQTQ